jgi:hypothetical protein
MTTPPQPGQEGRENQPFEPMPAAPPLDEQQAAPPPAAVDRPTSVDRSFILWVIAAGITLVSVLLTLTLGGDAITDAARETLRARGEQFSEDDVTQSATAFKTFTAIIGVLFAVLYVGFAYAMRGGKNWARIAIAILGGINLILVVLSSAGGGGLGLIINLAVAVLLLVAIYLMFRPDANQYFAARKRFS